MPRYKGSTRWSAERQRDGSWRIARERPWRCEAITVPADEGEWATTRERAQALFFWHRNHGLARREPHPMGKDLAALEAAWAAHHAERYRRAGMEPPRCYLSHCK